MFSAFRLVSSAERSTLSNCFFSGEIRFEAFSTISAESPKAEAILRAFDIPTDPIISLYVGRYVLVSKSIEAVSTPSVVKANSFNSPKCDVTTDLALSDKSFSHMLTARLAPSTGSVPAPSSSSKHSDLELTLDKMSIMFFMCDEKVERFCFIDCSSPISQNIPSKYDSSPLSAGMNIPHIAITVISPTSLSVTVLPPVLGPVIKSISLFNSIDTGTTFVGSMSGCLAFDSFIFPSSVKEGKTAFCFLAYCALANIKSICSIVAIVQSKTCSIEPISVENALSIFSISASSSSNRVLRLLLSSTICIGSINSVAPLDDWSCTSPFITPLYSALTGMTYLSPLIVTIESCKYLVYADELIYCDSVDLICALSFCILPLISLSVLEASSATSVSDKKEAYILSSSSLSKYSVFDIAERHGTLSGFCMAFSMPLAILKTLPVFKMSAIDKSPFLAANLMIEVISSMAKLGETENSNSTLSAS